METQNNRIILGACVVSLLIAVAFLGCEKTNRQVELIVTPNSAILSQAGQQATFMASLPEVANAGVSNGTSELLYPLDWSVSDESKGRIIATAGDSAVYQCSVGHGKNVVVVRDQGNREGLASVN